MQTISDAELVAECRQGNKDAFGFLVDKYKGAVYALAYHRVRNATDAEDVAQEAFLLAYKRLPSLKNPHCFASWLYTITVHCAISWLRKHARCGQYIEHRDSTGLTDVAEDAFRHQQLQNSVRDAIETLADSQRLPILLHYLGGLSTKETAQFLGISHGSVRVRLHRARQQLRKEFTGMLEPIPAALRLDAEFTIRLMERLQSIRLHRPIPVMPPVTIASISLFSILLLVASLFGLPNWMNLSPAQFGIDEPLQVELMATEVSADGPRSGTSDTPHPPVPGESHSMVQFCDGDGMDWGGSSPEHTFRERLWQRLQKQETTTLSGAVLHKRRPVSKATVYLFPRIDPHHQPVRLVTETDFQGYFQFDALPVTAYELAAYHLIAIAPGHALGYEVVTSLRRPQLAIVELGESRTLSGTVRGSDGRPVAGASIDVRACRRRLVGAAGLVPMRTYSAGFSGLLTTSTDESGGFTLTHLPDAEMVTVMVQAPGYGDTIATGKIGEPLDVTLAAPATVEGTVRFEDGRPASDISVSIPNLQCTRTDSEGRFTFTNVMPGQWDVECPLEPEPPKDSWQREWTPQSTVRVTAAAGETVEAHLMLIRGALVSGHVTDGASGKPISGAGIYCKDILHPGGGFGRVAAVTNTEGEYSLRAVPGEVMIVAPVPYGYGKLTTRGNWARNDDFVHRFTLEDGKHQQEIDFQFERLAGITGRVFLPEGGPAPGVLVLSDHIGDVIDRTDAEGGFVVGNLAQESLRFHVVHPSMPWAAFVQARSGEDVRVQLEPYELTQATGRVIDEQGNPLRGLRLMAFACSDNSGREPLMISIITDAKGRYTVESLAAGQKYVVSVNAPDAFTVESPEFVATTAPVQLDDLIVEFQPTTSLAGVVVDSAGKPLDKVQISWTIERQSGPTTHTDAEGHFYFNQVLGSTVSLHLFVIDRPPFSLLNVPTGRDDIRIVMPDRGDRNERGHADIRREWIPPAPEVPFEYVVEAEGFSHRGGVSNTTEAFLRVPDETASSGFCLMADPNGEVYDAAQSQWLAYEVEIPQNGNYAIWIRGMAQDGQSDSLHVATDLAPEPQTWDVRSIGEWAWLPVIPRSSRRQISDFHFTAGRHEIRVFAREHRTRFDAIFVTNDLGLNERKVSERMAK